MILKYHGVVSWGDDPCRCGDFERAEKEGTAWIGDVDLVSDLATRLNERNEQIRREHAQVQALTERERHFDVLGRPVVPFAAGPEFPPVTVAIADERYEGEIAIELGWGYSEYTPMDPDELTVGPHNLLGILGRYVGQTITLWVADEPFNTLEEGAQ